MVLKGTKTENDIREQLIESHNHLFDQSKNDKLLKALKSIQAMETAYILNWIPDQDEDVYIALINDAFIVRIELEKDSNNKPEYEFISLKKYRIGLRKQDQIKLEIALDLAKKYLKTI